MLVGQRFYGEPEHEVRAWNDGRFICSKNLETGGERWWGGSRQPVAVGTFAARAGVARSRCAARRCCATRRSTSRTSSPNRPSWSAGASSARSNTSISVAPGARESLRLAVVYTRTAPRRAGPCSKRCWTTRARCTTPSDTLPSGSPTRAFITPSPEISRGVAWAKANMLRIVKEYPHGWGSTNSPPSDILVSRDTSWFVHGFDYFWPEFSRNALEVFNRAVEPSGLMVEYVRGVSGYKTAYDLNINDDTPLHLIAMLHHYNATLDDAWVREKLPLVRALADYMLSQRDDRGLVFCKAKGVDMYGISSWRNIIPYYTLDGAVTEINAESVYALEAAAMLCAVAGDHANWEKYSGAGARPCAKR